MHVPNDTTYEEFNEIRFESIINTISDYRIRLESDIKRAQNSLNQIEKYVNLLDEYDQ